MSSDLVAAFFGARGQGKSTQAKALLEVQDPRRLLVFDPMDEYGPFADRVSSLGELLARVRAGGSFRLRYVPPPILGLEKKDGALIRTRFNTLCAIAYQAGELLLLADELQLVTAAGYAPPAWRQCTSTGRHVGLAIVGISQRPALIDKGLFSNATTVSTCRLNFEDDVQTMARVLGVSAERIRTLPRFRYIARDMTTGEVLEDDTEPAGSRRRASGSQKKTSTRRRGRPGP